MRQLLQSYRSGDLWLAKVPAPSCPARGVVVRTTCSVVSAGTERLVVSMAKKSLLGKAIARPDLVRQVLKRVQTEGLSTALGKVFTKLDEPITLGYSAAGTVVEAGPGAASFKPGDRVVMAGAGHATHAEFNAMPRNLCARIPPGLSDEDASFATIGAIALQGIRQAEPRLGERIAVIGLGLLGMLTVQMLKANGCAVLGVDPDPMKGALALELGIDVAVSSDAEAAGAAFTEGVGFDTVIITAATPSNGPMESAGALARMKGRVVVVGLVGMNVPRDVYYRKELDLRLSMSYGPGRYDAAYEEGGHDYPLAYVRFTEQRNMESFLYLVQQGKVTPAKLVTHRIPFDNALDAYLLLEGKLPEGHPLRRPYLGIVLEYPADAPLSRVVRREPAVVTGIGRGSLGLASIGAGGFAKGVLLPALRRIPACHLTGVCTTTGASADQAMRRNGFRFAATDPQAVFDDAETQAVIIATPHGSHAALACAALGVGKHVFVEKPLCVREADLAAYDEALIAARGDGRQPCLTVGFNRRFSPHAAVLAKAFAGRGTPLVMAYRVNAGRIPPDHWIQDPEIGGGRIIGEACHFVDFCGFLVGAAPVAVSAASIASGRRDVIASDSCVITIHYADGSLATVHYLAEGHSGLAKERCEVFGGGISAVMDDFRRTELFGVRGGLKGPQRKGFAEELEAFVSTCRNGGPWPIPWESLVATHAVCFAALRSLAGGGTVERLAT